MSRHGWTSKGRTSFAEKKKNGYFFRFNVDSELRVIPTVDEVLDRITDEPFSAQVVAICPDLEHNIGLVVASVEANVRSLRKKRKLKAVCITVARAIVSRCPKDAECYRNPAYVEAKAKSGHPIMTPNGLPLATVARNANKRALYCGLNGCDRCDKYYKEWQHKSVK